MTFIRCILFALGLSSGFSASASEETVRLTGRAQFWISELNNEMPTPPRKIGEPSVIDFKMSQPAQEGTVTYEIKNFFVDGYKASVKFIWKRPVDAKDYIIQQTELYESNGKLIALCTTYQFPKNITPIGVGACSGRHLNVLAGISLMQL